MTSQVCTCYNLWVPVVGMELVVCDMCQRPRPRIAKEYRPSVGKIVDAYPAHAPKIAVDIDTAKGVEEERFRRSLAKIESPHDREVLEFAAQRARELLVEQLDKMPTPDGFVDHDDLVPSWLHAASFYRGEKCDLSVTVELVNAQLRRELPELAIECVTKATLERLENELTDTSVKLRVARDVLGELQAERNELLRENRAFRLRAEDAERKLAKRK
jgi:hypothetical protein